MKSNATDSLIHIKYEFMFSKSASAALTKINEVSKECEKEMKQTL